MDPLLDTLYYILTTAILQNFRTRADIHLGHGLVLRGEQRREMELSDLGCLDVPDQGPSPCSAPCSLFVCEDEYDGQEALHGRDEASRSSYCPVGAVAQLHCWRWECSGEEPPDFSSRRSWYDIKLLVGEDARKPLSYPQQLDCIWAVFVACAIVSVEKTHAMRGSAVRAAELHGVTQEQVSSPFFDSTI